MVTSSDEGISRLILRAAQRKQLLHFRKWSCNWVRLPYSIADDKDHQFYWLRFMRNTTELDERVDSRKHHPFLILIEDVLVVLPALVFKRRLGYSVSVLTLYSSKCSRAASSLQEAY